MSPAARLAVISCLVSTPAFADPVKFTFTARGGYVFGDDQIFLGAQPDWPGWSDFGDGFSGLARLEARKEDWSLLVQFHHTQTKGDASAFRVVDFGFFTISADEDNRLKSRFSAVDIAAARHFSFGNVDASVLAGVRYLRADHDRSIRLALTNSFTGTTSVSQADLDVAFQGFGPRVAFSAQGPLSQRWGWFGQVGGSAVFGRARLSGDVPFSYDSTRVTTTAYSLDAELGLSVRLADGPPGTVPELGFGYRLDVWWNTNPDTFDPLHTPTTSAAIHNQPFVQLKIPF